MNGVMPSYAHVAQRLLSTPIARVLRPQCGCRYGMPHMDIMSS